MKKKYLVKTALTPLFTKTFLFCSTLALLSPSGSAFGGEAATAVEDALKGDWGQITLNLRYRFEHVEQDSLRTANGDPIRLRLGYLSPTFAGFQAFAEFEGNTPLFSNDYNDKSNGKTNYSVIVDPAEGELNQGWLSYQSIPDTTIKAGRQRINIDNQRFIGAVAWRQMEQTFDSVTLLNTSLGALDVNASYIWNVRSITSDDINMSSPLLNLKYSFKGIGAITAYGYWLDYDDATNSGGTGFANSTQTLGLRFNGKAAVADNLRLLYTAEYASQSDYQQNPTDYSADYYHFIGGLVAPNDDSLLTNITGKIGYEVLGSDNNVSFKTPLGTNHAFNGWADLFLTAPASGLQDLYGVLGATIAGTKFDMTYHDFQADSGGSDYGSEFDARISRKFGEHHTLLLAYADYSADEYKEDIQKFWLQLTVAF